MKKSRPTKKSYMKIALAICTILFLNVIVVAQNPTEINEKNLGKIRSEVEAETIALKNTLEIANSSKSQIEFCLDTFRIERLLEKRIALNNSDFDMREAILVCAVQYDSLLNKYYKKLLSTLKGNDKQILISAQKSWLAFRTNEMKLINTISKPEYSGGGTINQLGDASEYMDQIKQRVIIIYSHFRRAIQDF